MLTRDQLLAAGLGPRTLRRRIEAGRLFPLHRGVYAFRDPKIGLHGSWLAAVLACGKGALLSHRSAACLWDLMRPDDIPVEVSALSGRGRLGIAVHEGGIHRDERTAVEGIPVTSVARTLFDCAEVVDEHRLEKAFEEADRLGLLDIPALRRVCARGHGRRALRPIQRLLDDADEPSHPRSALESRFARFCKAQGLPRPATNVFKFGREVDALWEQARLMVEVDGFSFHAHRAAFERDRARDAAMQAEGYRVIRVTHRRLEREPEAVANEIRRILNLQGGRAGV